MPDKLAIRGGTPVRQAPFPEWPVFGREEEEALLRVLHSRKWWQFAYPETAAPAEDQPPAPRSEVNAFQEEFAAYHGCRFGIAAANGTATLEIILRSMNIGPGDEVIVPPYTFVASASAVLLVGAVPIFADICPDTLNLDPARIEDALSPRTRAVMPVHFGGQSADMDAIGAIARKHRLRVVEDAAHAHGAEWRGRKCGSLGDAGSFSFQASKNMTAGEGGIITTSDADLADLCRSYLWAGRKTGRPWYEHHRLGWNYRITEFQGAILRAQLGRLTEQTLRRDANGRFLAEELRKIPGIRPTRLDERATRVSFHLFMFRYEPEAFSGMTRDEFLAALNAEGIPCSGGYIHPLHRNPMFLNKDFWKDGFPCVPPFARDIDYADFTERCPASEAVCRDAVWIVQNMLLGTREDTADIATAVAKIQAAQAPKA